MSSLVQRKKPAKESAPTPAETSPQVADDKHDKSA